MTSSPEGEDYDPCMQVGLPKWLNRADVQRALHVNRTTPLPVAWQEISPVLRYSMDSMYSDATQHYRNFFADKSGAESWRILIYSGISDGAVPFRGTERWVRCLGRPVVNNWHTWTADKQVAGLVMDYDRLSLCSIRTTGHMVPMYTPQKGFYFFQRWVDDFPI